MGDSVGGGVHRRPMSPIMWSPCAFLARSTLDARQNRRTRATLKVRMDERDRDRFLSKFGGLDVKVGKVSPA